MARRDSSLASLTRWASPPLRVVAGLPDPDVAEADLLQQGQLVHHVRKGRELAERMVDRHIQHVGDAITLELHLQGLAVEALAVADITRHIDIGQELHLDAQLTLALAGLAAPAMHVEGETPGLVAAHLAFRQLGEQLADLVEHAGIGPGVRARRAADGGLVDVDDLIQMFDAFDALDARRPACARPSTWRPGRCRAHRSSAWICRFRKRR